MTSPATTPSTGSLPYGLAPTSPAIRTTPAITIGKATTIERRGRSPYSAQAAIPTTTTWRLPRTVASPAPTASIEWAQKVRSAAKKQPATSENQIVRRSSGP